MFKTINWDAQTCSSFLNSVHSLQRQCRASTVQCLLTHWACSENWPRALRPPRAATAYLCHLVARPAPNLNWNFQLKGFYVLACNFTICRLTGVSVRRRTSSAFQMIRLRWFILGFYYELMASLSNDKLSFWKTTHMLFTWDRLTAMIAVQSEWIRAPLFKNLLRIFSLDCSFNWRIQF